MEEEVEIWAAIAGYEESYEVSNFGKVRRIGSDTPLRIQLTEKKYCRITLSKDDNKKHFKLHRLVALAFISNPENKAQVNHKDGDKFNNHHKNLEWATNGENNDHALKNGLHSAVKPRKPTSIIIRLPYSEFEKFSDKFSEYKIL